MTHKFLGIPSAIWGLQLLYVALALGLFAVISAKYKQAHQLSFQVSYVLIMIVINIIWRVAIKKLKPGWF
jgi:hypothetical protein